MSTKTIAVDSEVYRKLAGFKRESESFSRAIDRLIDEVVTAHTGAEILRRLEEAPPPLRDDEVKKMKKVIEAARECEEWFVHDLS